jgi:TPR repeat protein
MCTVGNFYRYGWGGVAQDDRQALKWYSAAVEKASECQYQLGDLYYEGNGVAKDYKKASELLLQEVQDKGGVYRADAAFDLGFIYNVGGYGVQRDFAEAAKWYKTVIELPLDSGLSSEGQQSTRTLAEVNLGKLYRSGNGVPQNYAEAMALFRRAADSGDSAAQVQIGISYEDGEGVSRDYGEAVKWYRLAAEQNDSEGQIFLGSAYRSGNGVPQDYVLAHMWFNLAAANGKPDSAIRRDLLADQMTKDQIAEAQRLAREWKPKPPAKK